MLSEPRTTEPQVDPGSPDPKLACATADEREIARWTGAQRNCTNTGLLCGDIIGVDVDVPVEALAAEIEGLAREMLEATPLKRIGSAPKVLLTFRAEHPDDSVVRVEVLATGQQFVAFGIHPATRSDYLWPERTPSRCRRPSCRW